MEACSRSHPSYVYGPAPGKRASRQPLRAYGSMEDLRGRFRSREGLSTRPQRPASAKHTGIRTSAEFTSNTSRLQTKSTHGRKTRPASAGSAKFKVPTPQEAAKVADDPERQLKEATRGRAPRDVTGLIVADREFTWAMKRRARPGSSVRQLIDGRKKPAEKEREAQVERTLEQVKEDYFPVSRLWCAAACGLSLLLPLPASAASPRGSLLTANRRVCPVVCSAGRSATRPTASRARAAARAAAAGSAPAASAASRAAASSCGRGSTTSTASARRRCSGGSHSSSGRSLWRTVSSPAYGGSSSSCRCAPHPDALTHAHRAHSSGRRLVRSELFCYLAGC
eukprot:COSAG05_NODE_946_length_6457_cov_4.475243_6_plen_339_part_00